MKNIETKNIELLSKEPLMCDFCNKVSADVEGTADPFEVEMTGGDTLVNMCDACYMDRRLAL